MTCTLQAQTSKGAAVLGVPCCARVPLSGLCSPVSLCPVAAAAEAEPCSARFPRRPGQPVSGTVTVLSLRSPPQSVADSSWITELLWTFFAPFTVYQVRYYLSFSHLGQGSGWAERLTCLLTHTPGVVSQRDLSVRGPAPGPASEAGALLAPAFCW